MKQIALILLSLLLVACSGGIDPVEPPSELTGFKPELRLLPNWSQSVGNGSGGKYLRLQPLLDGEQIVVADHFGLVRAFDAVNGERLWQMDLGRTINAGAGYAEGVLLFGGDAEVFAIERSSGRLRWSQEISSEVLAAPVAEGDTIVVHAVDGSISALNRHDGAILWRHHENVPSLTLRGTSRPLIVNGSRVVVGGAAGQVVALELQSGNLLWSSAVATARGRTDLERMVDVDAELVAADGVVYVSAYQGYVAAIDVVTGRLLWTREISSQSGIVLDEQAIYFSDSDANVWALSRANGATLWKQGMMVRRALSIPAQQGRYIILGDFDGYLHWLNKEDGRLAGRTRVQDFNEHFPIKSEAYPFSFKERRALLVAPIVEGTRVYGLDQRGVLDAYTVSVIKVTAE